MHYNSVATDESVGYTYKDETWAIELKDELTFE